MTRGKVYLVGAGPGDPGLLTVRGREVLRTAEVVLYDGLVGRGLLRWIPRGARRLRVAKGPRHDDRFPQAKISEVMVREALAGKRVVRLKGGDALLFSRGGEEAETLRARRIPFEIVPGVTSALAGPAYAGIPLTERGFSSSVAIVTGRESSAPGHRPVNWAGLARSADTLVVLMGVGTLRHAVRELLGAGRSPETPVSAIEWATTPRQRTTLFTLGEANRPAVRARLESPAVLVIGATVVRGYRLGWYRREVRWSSPRFRRLAARSRYDPLSGEPVHSGRPRSPPHPPLANDPRPAREHPRRKLRSGPGRPAGTAHGTGRRATRA